MVFEMGRWPERRRWTSSEQFSKRTAESGSAARSRGIIDKTPIPQGPSGYRSELSDLIEHEGEAYLGELREKLFGPSTYVENPAAQTYLAHGSLENVANAYIEHATRNLRDGSGELRSDAFAQNAIRSIHGKAYRMAQLYDIFDRDPSLSAAEAAGHLGVSEETVNRYLETAEQLRSDNDSA